MNLARTRLSRWFLPLLAVVSAGITLTFVATDPDYPFHLALFEGAFALVLAGALFAVGYRYFATTDLPETDARTVALWTLTGFGVFATMNVWSRTVGVVIGETEPQFIAVTTLTAGALGGAAIGITIARARRRHAEREQALADYRELFETAEDGIFIDDPEDGTILEVNERGAEMLGYTVEELEGMPIGAISANSSEFGQERAMRVMQRALEGEPQQFDWLLQRKDGSTLWVEVSLKRTTLGDEDRLIAFVRDASERKRRERDLAFFEEMVETVGVGVGVYGADGRFEYANEAYADLLGTDRETIEGTPIWEVSPEFDRERFDDYWTSFEEGETRTAEAVHALGDCEVPVQTVTTRREIDGTAYHLGTVQEITERKEREQKLETRAAAMEASIDGIAILDETEQYQFVNQAHADVYGYEDPDAMVGETWRICYAEDELARFEEEVVPTLFEEGSWRGEATGRRKDGSTFPQEVSLSVTDGGGIVCVVRDITERKKHERQIAGLHDATREMIQASDEAAVCETAMRTAATLLEFPIATIWLYDESGERLEPVAATDEAEALFDDLPVYTGGNSRSWRAYATGETFVFDDLQDESGLYNPDTRIRSELVLPLGEYGVVNAGSTEPGSFTESDIVLARLFAANTQAALERVERERDLERQTDRMEFFNSILRHDVLNGITVIKARADFLAEGLEGEQLRDAETIVQWSDDIVDIVQRVRAVLETLTGEGDPDLEPVDLASTLRSEIERVRSAYPAVAFETDVPDDVSVLADDLLGEVLGNVITNAVDHNDTDDLTVSVVVEVGDETVSVRIADDGRGIPDEYKEAVFRRDETGHAKSTGSGFGLFFVDSMVSEYGGDVWVEDNEDGGATFVIRLPAAERAAAA